MNQIHIIGDHPRAQRLRDFAKTHSCKVSDLFEASSVEASNKYTIYIGTDMPTQPAHVWCQTSTVKSAKEAINTIRNDRTKANVAIAVIENIPILGHLPIMHIVCHGNKITTLHNDRDLDIFLLEQAQAWGS